jgi:methylphosphotriester-DNA--protein-cysteine methyltransferase
MRTFLTLALTLSTLGLAAQTTIQAVQTPVPVAAGYVGNKEAKIYHLPGCKLVIKIKPENKVVFATKEEAVQAGYAPDKICIK